MHAHDISLDGVWLSKLASGARAVVTELEGWWDSAEPNLRDDGEVDPAEPWLPRAVSLAGTVSAESHDELHEAGELLASMLRPGGMLTVVGHGPTMSAQVSRAGRVRFTTVTDRLGQWSVTLRARDPRKFGGYQSPVTLDPEGMVFHRGNTDALPVVEVTGSAPSGYALVDEGDRRFEVRSPLAGTHTVDMSTGRAYENGAPVPRYGRAQIVHVRPGMPQRIRVEPLGAGTITATVTVQDTWI